MIASVLDRLDELQEKWKYLGPKLLFAVEANNVTDEQIEIAEMVENFYINGTNFTLESKWELLDMASDILYISATYEAAQYQAAIGSAPVFFYELAHRFVKKTRKSENGWRCCSS